MQHDKHKPITLAERSARTREQIINARRDRLMIDYSYQEGDAMINVTAPRLSIRRSLQHAIQFELRRNRGTLQYGVDNHLSVAYCYWFNIVGLSNADIRIAWTRSK